MSDIIKIISPSTAKTRMQDITRAPKADVPFDIESVHRHTDGALDVQEADARRQPSTSGHMMRPLLEHTKACAEGIRKLVLYSRLFLHTSDVIDEVFLDRLFILPADVFEEILALDEGASVYRGEFFQMLRAFAGSEEFLELRDPILSILKHFDCYVQKEHTLDTIRIYAKQLSEQLQEPDSAGDSPLEELLQELEKFDSSGEGYETTAAFLKEELIPFLQTVERPLPARHPVRDTVRLLVHYIVRFDRADPALLDQAYGDFAQALTLLFPNVGSEEVEELKTLLLESGDEQIRQNLTEDSGGSTGELLERLLDESAPKKLQAFARSFLLQLIQNESPAQPYLHFIVPLRFRHEDVYAEFFIDKRSSKAHEDAEQAFNIFFTIQSDAFGTFEVDLIASNRAVELTVYAPEALLADVQRLQGTVQKIIESSGMRLAGYRTQLFVDSKAILKQFPHLRHRKVGLNVKV